MQSLLGVTVEPGAKRYQQQIFRVLDEHLAPLLEVYQYHGIYLYFV